MKRVFVLYPNRKGLFPGLPPIDYLNERLASDLADAVIVSFARAQEWLNKATAMRNQLAQKAADSPKQPLDRDVMLLGWLCVAIARMEAWFAKAHALPKDPAPAEQEGIREEVPVVACSDCKYQYDQAFCGTHCGTKYKQPEVVLCCERNSDGGCKLFGLRET